MTFRPFMTAHGALRRLLRRLSPVQILALGFVLLSLVGTGLLMLPLATESGQGQPLVDALFVSTSAVSTTGLSVVDVGSYYSPFGELVILILFQLGGLGYMTFVVVITSLFGQSLSLRGQRIVKESLAMPSVGEARIFVKKVLLFALLFEGTGAIALTLYWLPRFGLWRAGYLGIFHAISAFCTAGFSVFSDSFSAYRDDLSINVVISLLSIGGAIGFLVLSDLHRLVQKAAARIRPRRLLTHSKLALLMLVTFAVLGTSVLLLAEGQQAPRFWGSQVLAAVFQAISATTTTGFNTIDIGALSNPSFMVVIMIMFVGAPAGGTGGGIKSTTFAVMLLSLKALLSGNDDVNVFRRRLSAVAISRAFAIALLAAMWIMTVSTLLAITETLPLPPLIFEVVSALGTVGLSTGITADLSVIGRIVISVTMLIGRLGPLSVGFSLVGPKQSVSYRYPVEDVFVG